MGTTREAVGSVTRRSWILKEMKIRPMQTNN